MGLRFRLHPRSYQEENGRHNPNCYRHGVIVAHEVGRECFAFLLLSKLGRDRLKLFNEGVLGTLAFDLRDSVVAHCDLLQPGAIERPRGNRHFAIRSRVVKAHFK